MRRSPSFCADDPEGPWQADEQLRLSILTVVLFGAQVQSSPESVPGSSHVSRVKFESNPTRCPRDRAAGTQAVAWQGLQKITLTRRGALMIERMRNRVAYSIEVALLCLGLLAVWSLTLVVMARAGR